MCGQVAVGSTGTGMLGFVEWPALTAGRTGTNPSANPSASPAPRPRASYRVRLFDALRDALYSTRPDSNVPPPVPSLDLLRIISQYLEVRERLAVWQKTALHQIELESSSSSDPGRVSECRLISDRPTDMNGGLYSTAVPLSLNMKRIASEKRTGSGSGGDADGDGDRLRRYAISIKAHDRYIRILKSCLDEDETDGTNQSGDAEDPPSLGVDPNAVPPPPPGILCELLIPTSDLGFIGSAEFIGIDPIHLPILSSPHTLKTNRLEVVMGSVFFLSAHSTPNYPSSDLWYSRVHRLDMFGAIHRPNLLTGTVKTALETVKRTELSPLPIKRIQPGLAYDPLTQYVYMTCGTDETGRDNHTPAAAMDNARYSITQ